MYSHKNITVLKWEQTLENVTQYPPTDNNTNNYKREYTYIYLVYVIKLKEINNKSIIQENHWSTYSSIVAVSCPELISAITDWKQNLSYTKLQTTTEKKKIPIF